MSRKYKCKVLQHPGGNLGDAASDRNSFFYAQELNKAKICVTCSGKPRSRFGKYIEIPMSGAALSADMPGEEQEKFKQFMIQIDMNMSDEEIINKLTYYLENEKERQKLVDKGYEYAIEYTQEKYAQKFLEVVNELG